MPSFDHRSQDANHCSDLAHCRTIWNVVWSCLATIFSCTWVAIHPNIPCPKTREANSRIQRWVWNPLLSFAEHRLPLFVCALLVPEYVLAWAIRQFLEARKTANDNRSEFENLCIVIDSNHSKEHIVRATMVDDPRVLYHHGGIPSL